jgi:hypothetical protein
VVVGVASAAWLTRNFFYFLDDFIFIRQAQQSSLTFEYLRSKTFQHFSPISRLADFVLAHWLHSSVAAAHIVELVLLTLSMLAFSWAITELVGRRLWRHLLTLAFGESLAMIHLLGWWTATANILPATLLGLVTVAAFVRYRRLRQRQWAVISILSFALSLAAHEQSWLVFGYLVLFELLIFAPGGRIRAALARMWQEAWIWICYAVLTGLAMANYFIVYYAPFGPKRATPDELIRYFGMQFVQSFAPSAFGLRPLTTGWANALSLDLDLTLFLVIVAVSIYLRPGAWRVWTVFGVGFLANSLMTGGDRVGFFGVDFGKDLYYIQSPAWLFLLCVGMAFSIPARRKRGLAHIHRPSAPFVRIGLLGVVFLALGLYEVAFFASASTANTKDPHSQFSQAARAYFARLTSQFEAATRHGARAALLDTPAPGSFAGPFVPYNQLSSLLAILNPSIPVGRLRPEIFEVASDGSLIRLRVQSESARHLAAVHGDFGAIPVPPLSQRDASNGVAENCFRIARAGGTIDARVTSPIAVPRAWLVVGLSNSSGGSVIVSMSGRDTHTLGQTLMPTASNKADDYLVPLSSQTSDRVELSATTAGGDLCISHVEVVMVNRLPITSR